MSAVLGAIKAYLFSRFQMARVKSLRSHANDVTHDRFQVIEIRLSSEQRTGTVRSRHEAAFAHRNTAHDNRFECPMQTPRNKRRKFASAASASSARRRLFSNSGKDGVIAPRPMIMGGTDDADGADGTDGTDRLFSCCAHPDD